jgi:uncharacterized protein DUF4145
MIMAATTFIDCPQCSTRVEATLLQDWLMHDLDRMAFVWCARCRNVLVGFQQFLGPVGEHGEEEYSETKRLWPMPAVSLSDDIPQIIYSSLTEAQQCLSCGSYTASVAMTGRALEGLCHHFTTSNATLFDGLKELLTRGIIDTRLYQWADELRKHRNLAAHASGVSFERQDAQDIFDFAVAICDYVFVLTKKFEEFQQRIKT